VILRPLACWDCGLESRRWHGCLSVVSVVCCQVEVSATGRSLVQRSHTECSVSEEPDKDDLGLLRLLFQYKVYGVCVFIFSSEVHVPGHHIAIAIIFCMRRLILRGTR
jgi:hypothetical protein